MKRWAVPLIGVLLFMTYLATGLVVVAPGEVVVVRRFGKAIRPPLEAGPHVVAPIGIDRRDRVRIDLLRTIELGRDGPEATEYLTADLNLVIARGVAQYRVADPIAHVTSTGDLEALLDRIGEATLARALSRFTIDEVLKASGSAIAFEAEKALREEVKQRALGLEILSVRLAEVRPPSEVRPDFDAAQAAKDGVARRTTDAHTRAEVLKTQTSAEASTRTREAAARADRAVVLARAKAERFEALLEESRRDRALTVERLYRDSLKDLLPKVRRKVVLGQDEAIDLSIPGLAPEE